MATVRLSTRGPGRRLSPFSCFAKACRLAWRVFRFAIEGCAPHVNVLNPEQPVIARCSANKHLTFVVSSLVPQAFGRTSQAEEISMRKPILAGATVLALAAGMTSIATASDRNGDGSRSHVGRVHAGGMHSFAARRASRFAGVRGFENARHGGWEGGNAYSYGGYKNLGPLGIMFGCGQRGACGQGYSVSAWSY
jgi:hypothetical protein